MSKVVEVHLDELAKNVFDRCGNDLLSGLVDTVAKAVLTQLNDACNQQNLDLGDACPCLGNLFRTAGRQFKRGMNDVEVLHEE